MIANGFGIKSQYTYQSKIRNLCYLSPFPNKPWFFTCLHYKSFENTMEKEEIARNEQFLHFSQRFLPVWRTFCRFHQICNCRMQTH